MGKKRDDKLISGLAFTFVGRMTGLVQHI